MKRVHQSVLIGSTLIGSWLGMQAIHECGHVLGLRLTGGSVQRVVLHPLTISHTEASANPHPLVVVWAGPVLGDLKHLLLWGLIRVTGTAIGFLVRFFAGFCLIANGAYLGFGSLGGIGDCGELLRHGASNWELWLFGLLTIPIGLFLWHNQGTDFGFGTAQGRVNIRLAYGCLATVCLGVAAECFLTMR